MGICIDAEEQVMNMDGDLLKVHRNYITIYIFCSLRSFLRAFDAFTRALQLPIPDRVQRFQILIQQSHRCIKIRSPTSLALEVSDHDCTCVIPGPPKPQANVLRAGVQ